MLLVQKYNSLAEIEHEFKEALEGLIASEVFSLQVFERYEKEKPAEHVFYYYLFFGQTSNMPVGMCMIELVSLTENKFTPFFTRIMNKMKRKEHPKWLRFMGPGKQKNFFFFEPKYQKLGMAELTKIVNEMKKRDDVVVIEEWSNAGSKILFGSEETKAFKSQTSVLSIMKKAYQSYEDYFRSLSENATRAVKVGWKTLTRDQKFILTENVESTLIPAHHKLKNYPAHCTASVIEDETGPLAAILYIEAKGKKLHVDFLHYRDHESLSETMMLQSALMKFYDSADYTEINFLSDFNMGMEELKEQGLVFLPVSQSIVATNEFVAGVLNADDLRRYS